MEELKYIIEDSTIAEVLGVENFKNEESAILELVKNAYDAQALNVIIVISDKQIIIEDDGIGMNHKKILDAWMHIGKSGKKYTTGKGKDIRVLAGSKGVGRFAIARLGAKASVYTKMEQEEAVLWKTNWNTNTLESYNETKEKGTKIIIEDLRDNWTENRVLNLQEFLSRTYNDDKMKIKTEYKGERKEIKKYFGKIQLGINCTSVITLNYNAEIQKLTCNIKSDEFKEKVKEFYKDNDLYEKNITLDITEELKEIKRDFSEEIEDTEWKKLLKGIGDFSAELYFSLKNPSSQDAERFFYKHKILEKRYEPGVILYRNAFSISSYEGKKDWLEFGKRSRISPAAATHPTGSWRIRENQISGKVIIDKARNYNLSDLMNRQGLVENDSYKLFHAIIISGISSFERYRQGIIRSIIKNGVPLRKTDIKVIDSIIKNPAKLVNLSSKEKEKFVNELEQIKNENKETIKQINETEKQYKYDIRLLNMLATSGLKAVSIAHEMYNYRNSINENVNYIINALKRYGLWDTVDSEENKKYMHRNIPALLEKNMKVNKKIITFMDVMLSESEKKQFMPENINLYELFKDIKLIWERDYSWVEINLDIEEELKWKSARDIFRVIFDNLVLNSIQQNDDKSILNINISVKNNGKYIDILYEDNGNGLPKKYMPDPMRILEVHETSRKRGHGIGMWIVNNTVINTGGEIQDIEGINGFKIKFILGEKI